MNALTEFMAEYAISFWVTIGVILLIVEVLMVSGFFVSFAVSAFVVATGVWLNLLPPTPLWTTFLFVTLGVIFIPIFRKMLRRYADRTPDINRY